jgi:hypothetical protein
MNSLASLAVRPKELKIHKQYIPTPIGGDGASNAEQVVKNFGNMINGRDLSALVAALKGNND